MAGRGHRRHLVNLENPTDTPDGEGGFLQVWTALDPPELFAEILSASARDLERFVAGTVQSTASHVITMDYHDQVTTKTRVLFNGRIFQVTGVRNVDERDIDLQLACEEVVT